MIEKHNCRQIGLIVKAHGIAGEIVIRLFNEFSVDDMDTEFLFLDLDGGLVPFYLEEARQRNKTDVLAKLDQIKDEKSAAQVMDAPVYVKKMETAVEGEAVDEQGSSAYQLIGYQCQAIGHGSIGEIVAIKEISKNPLFEIDHEGKEILIPIVEDFIAGIDDEKRTILFELPEGLIELE